MSNLHSEQKGNQVHKPKKFEDAGASSMLYKDSNGRVGYVHRDISHSSLIQTVAATYGNLHNTYLKIYKFNNKCITALYFSVSGQTAEWTKPTDCDDAYSVPIESDASALEVSTAIKNWFDSNTDYGTATLTEEDTVTIVYANRSIIDVSNSLFSLTNTPTNPSNDSILISDQSDSGQLKFQELNETVQDIVGAMFTGNTETNITATYEDSDGTIDLVATGGSSGNAFTTINCPSGSNPVADSTSDTLTLLAGTNISITGNSGGDSVTIANTATDTNTQIISETYRFITQDLAPSAGTYYGYNSGNHNKDGKIEQSLGDTMTNLTSNYGLWSSLYMRPYYAGDYDTNTYQFTKCDSAMTGSSGASVVLEIYKYSPCGLESNFGTATRVAYATHELEGNTATKCVDWTLESSESRTLASRDILVLALSVSESLEDLDCRGLFSFEITRT